MTENRTTPEPSDEPRVAADATPTVPSAPADHLPATPGDVEPALAQSDPDAAAARRPFLQRTWVRVTGAAVAAVVLLGTGAGLGAAATTAVLVGGHHVGGAPGFADDDGDHDGDGHGMERPDAGPRGDRGDGRPGPNVPGGRSGPDSDQPGPDSDDSGSDSDEGVTPAPDATP